MKELMFVSIYVFTLIMVFLMSGIEVQEVTQVILGK
jgi:hypothetical protein